MIARALRCAALAIVFASCGSRDAPTVAELVHAEARVEAEHRGAWSIARPGERFSVGDAVRTGPASAARLSLAGGGVVRVGEQALLRFARGGGARTRISVEAGEAETEALGEGDVEIATEIGPARVEAGSRLRLSAHDRGTRVEVLVGRAVIQRESGEAVSIAAGEQVLVTVGGARIERTTREPTPPAPPPPSPPPSDADGVAATVRGSGAEARDPGADWRPLAPGKTRLGAATELRVARRTSIELARGDERATIDGPAELTIGAAGKPLFDARRGSAVLHADAGAITIAVPGGTITARRGSRAEISVGTRGASIQVPRGAVDVSGDTIRSGERATIDPDGDVSVTGRTAARADFTIPAGESATIHDPRRRTSVRIRFAEVCGADGGVVEVGGERVSGVEAAVVALRRGSRSYRVRCRAEGQLEDRSRASGTLRIALDSGTAPIPKNPPANVIDADGRHYTVLYQNLLPALTLRWPGAPSAEAFDLHLEGRGGPKVVRAAAATHTFSSGEVREGTYTWWFSTGTRQSPRTKLSIDFDNAAPAAQVVEPRDGAAWGESARVSVSGTVSEGWTVSVAGRALAIDSRRRFAAEVAIPDGDDAVSVRLEHASRGVHYYVRRPKK